MRRPRMSFYHILIFVLAQIAWLSLLGIWIYWYVSNYIIFSEVDDKLSAEIVTEGRNVFVLVSGLVLLIVVSVLMSLQFYRLNTQFHQAHLYDNFIANITHELKSPLASVQLALETLNLHDIPESKRQLFIRMMLKDVDRLNKLINAILEIPALEQKKIAHNYHVYPIGPLIRELVQEAAEQFGLTKNNLEVRGSGDCQCVVDRNALRIVLDNLIDNSIKYSTGAARILITLQCESKHFILKYQDQGIGLSGSDQKRVFDKFFRTQNRNSPNVKGTGLGLYWTREIVKYHGGKISVDSAGPGQGTAFLIQLPIYQVTKKRYIQNLLKIAKKRQREEEAPDE